MINCPVCQKQKAETEMRPLINVAELKVGATLAEAKVEREIAGAKLQIVCRACWAAILAAMPKEDVIEMMETLSILLFEMEKRAAPAMIANEEWIEKFKGGFNQQPMLPPPWAIQPQVYKQPMVPQGPQWVAPHFVGDGNGTADGGFTIGTSIVPMGAINKLRDDFQMMMCVNTK